MATMTRTISDSNVDDMMDEQKLALKLQQHLGPQFASHRHEILGCEIDRVNFHPNRGCRFLIRADIKDGNSEVKSRHMFFAHRVPPSRNVQRLFSSYKTRPLVQPSYGLPITHIPEWRMIVWAYPNDPGLPGLAAIGVSERVLAKAQHAPETFGLDRAPVAVRGEMVKYTPRKRCGFFYYFQTSTQEPGQSVAEFRVYGKAYQRDRGPEVEAIYRQLW
ncbi:hypothetical protein MJD09_10690, partial [bacterium]|nr:hypothetical protein [bacterium]